MGEPTPGGRSNVWPNGRLKERARKLPEVASSLKSPSGDCRSSQ